MNKPSQVILGAMKRLCKLKNQNSSSGDIILNYKKGQSYGSQIESSRVVFLYFFARIIGGLCL